MSIKVKSGGLKLNGNYLSFTILGESFTKLVFSDFVRDELDEDIRIVGLFNVSLDRGVIVGHVINALADMLINEKVSTIGKLLLIHLIHSFNCTLRVSKRYVSVVLELCITFCIVVSMYMS